MSCVFLRDCDSAGVDWKPASAAHFAPRGVPRTATRRLPPLEGTGVTATRGQPGRETIPTADGAAQRPALRNRRRPAARRPPPPGFTSAFSPAAPRSARLDALALGQQPATRRPRPDTSPARLEFGFSTELSAHSPGARRSPREDTLGPLAQAPPSPISDSAHSWALPSPRVLIPPPDPTPRMPLPPISDSTHALTLPRPQLRPRPAPLCKLRFHSLPDCPTQALLTPPTPGPAPHLALTPPSAPPCGSRRLEGRRPSAVWIVRRERLGRLAAGGSRFFAFPGARACPPVSRAGVRAAKNQVSRKMLGIFSAETAEIQETLL